MQALNEITKILSAMGAKPETITRPDGEKLIRVNAPQIGNGGTNEKSKN